jgi:ribosomal-protein-alanine N-acetyltransferase
VPVFETPRLIVRRLSRQDLPALTAILSDPKVMEYSVRGVCDEAATARFIDGCLDCYAAHGMGPWALEDKASHELVGFCGVSPEAVNGIEEANLGYRLARRYWGQGLASEAARGVLDALRASGQLESVVVIIEPEHIASLKVAERAGFKDFEVLEFHGRPVRLYRLNALAGPAGTLP